MRFLEVANRLTGISCPVFGVSWTPSELEVTTARRVISFLEDRCVLYNPTEVELPEHCVRSVLEIRQFLTPQLGEMDPQDELSKNLTAMRTACRKFLDSITPVMSDGLQHNSLRGFSEWVFISALGEMRGIIGLHVALIATRNGLDLGRDLARIVPAEDAESKDSFTELSPFLDF